MNTCVKSSWPMMFAACYIVSVLAWHAHVVHIRIPTSHTRRLFHWCLGFGPGREGKALRDGLPDRLQERALHTRRTRRREFRILRRLKRCMIRFFSWLSIPLLFTTTNLFTTSPPPSALLHIKNIPVNLHDLVSTRHIKHRLSQGKAYTMCHII